VAAQSNFDSKPAPGRTQKRKFKILLQIKLPFNYMFHPFTKLKRSPTQKKKKKKNLETQKQDSILVQIGIIDSAKQIRLYNVFSRQAIGIQRVAPTESNE
jgi:hypothetical protein